MQPNPKCHEDEHDPTNAACICFDAPSPSTLERMLSGPRKENRTP